MAYEFRLPDLGEGLTEGEVARWLVREGQDVAEDDPLVEIQTDKATVEIPSPAAGVVWKILVREGEVVPVGTVLVVIGEGPPVSQSPQGAMAEGHVAAPQKDVAGGQTPDTRTPDVAGGLAGGQTPVAPAGGRARATPLVRRVAQELGVDLEAVAGSGPQGRISEEDVRRAAMSEGQSLGPGRLGPGPQGRREPLRGLRRAIAGHLAEAHREVPAVTWVEECEFERVDLDKLVAVTVKACALALREFPELNARLQGEDIVYLDRYDIGVAVQTARGLVVPVVRGCDTLSVEEIDAELRRLAAAAHAAALKPEEVRGSTFTVTSAGKVAGLFQTPIVNYPEAAILSIGRIAPRPVVRDGEIVVRRMGMIALTFDHRVVDGARAGAFGLAVIERLQRADEL